MANEIVHRDEEIVIPSTDLPGLKEQLDAVETLTAQIPALRQRAQKIEVINSAEEYRTMGEVLSDTRGVRKQGVAIFGPFDSIVDKVRSFLRIRKARHENQCEEVEGICKAKMKSWEQRELAASKAEEEARNKKAPKDEHVEVKPNIPSTPGYRRTTNYYAQMQDFDKFLKVFRTACNAASKKKDAREKAEYLRRFITWDAKELNAEARKIQDPKKLAEMIPGINAWSD